MRTLLKTFGFILFISSTLVSSHLSAWYDPTGYWGKHYSNYYYLPSRGNYTIRGELLYLRAHVDNVKVNRAAIADTFNDFPGETFIYNNDERKRRFKWRYGFKLGFGYACSDCWEADVNWTHYQTRARISDFDAADTKWKLFLDFYDLEIGKEMWFRRCFRLKPFIGMRIAEIKQRYKFEINGNILNPAIPFPIPFGIDGVLRHNYLAGGPRVGFDASWCVGCGFNIYVTAAANYLYGEAQNRYKDSFIVAGEDKDHHWEGSGITDLGCGVGWSDLWWGERRRLRFRFGYEHHYFINENRLDNEGAILKRKRTNWFIQGIGGSIAVDF